MTDAPRPLSMAERGRLGGLTAAHRMSPEERTRRAAKGGAAALEKLGKAHYVRMTLIRAGRLPKEKRPSPTT